MSALERDLIYDRCRIGQQRRQPEDAGNEKSKRSPHQQHRATHTQGPQKQNKRDECENIPNPASILIEVSQTTRGTQKFNISLPLVTVLHTYIQSVTETSTTLRTLNIQQNYNTQYDGIAGR